MNGQSTNRTGTVESAARSPSPHDEGVGRRGADLPFSNWRLLRIFPELRWIGWHEAMIFQLPRDFRTTRPAMQRRPDVQQHALPVLAPLMIPKPQLFDPLVLQELCSHFIPAALIRKAVDKTIQFDGKSRRRTVKIDKVRGERMLAAKLKTGKSASAQGAPKFFLFSSLLASKTAGISGGIHASDSSRIDGRNKKPLSLPLSPRRRSGEREYALVLVVASSNRAANLTPDT